MKTLCAYCATREGTTWAEVPPRICFARPPAGLPAVPVCEECRSEFIGQSERASPLLRLRLGTERVPPPRFYDPLMGSGACDRTQWRGMRDCMENAWTPAAGIAHHLAFPYQQPGQW